MTARFKNHRRAPRHRNPERLRAGSSDPGSRLTAGEFTGLGSPFARHIGRIGVLAVSLGVGAAVATGCGAAVASADSDSTGSETAASSESPSAPQSSADPGQVADTGTAASGTRAGHDSTAHSRRKDRAVPDGTVRASGGAHTSTASEQDGDNAATSVQGTRESDAESTDPPPERPAATPGKHRPTNDSAVRDRSPAPARHRRAEAPSSTTATSQDGDTPAGPRSTRGRHAAPSDASTSADESAAVLRPAASPPPSEADTSLPVPAVAAADEPPRAAVVLAAAVLSPLLGPGPDSAPESPVLWALLAASRRESQGAVLRRASSTSADAVTAAEPVAPADARLITAKATSDAALIEDSITSAAVADSATTPVRTAVDIDVLANDVDASKLVDFTQPSNGTAVSLDGRAITYTPDYTFHGTDGFTYTVADAQGIVSTATVTVEVTNGDPVAVDDTANATADVPQKIDVIGNDSDPEGQQLTVRLASDPAHGTVLDNYDGTFTYIADNGFTGDDTFTYSVTDPFGATATATVTVAVERNYRAPYAGDSQYVMNRNTTLRVPVEIGLLANDGDLDFDTVTVQSVTQPAHGTVEFAPDGSFTYVPDRAYTGNDGFDYTIVDATGATASASVAITIDPYNRAPVAVYDAANASTENPVATGNVLSNDFDPDGDPLTVTLGEKPTSGTVTLDADGNFTYTANPGFVGSDSFGYQLSDGFDTTEGTVHIDVTAPNGAPTAKDDTAIADAGDQTFIDVLANDSDPDGDELTITNVGDAQHGTTAQARGGQIEYIADDDFGGTDTFTYEITDGNGNTSTATVTVTVKPGNQFPTAADDVATTTAGTPITIDVLANDSDPDGDPLTVEMYGGPDYGSAVVEKDGTIRFTPAPGFVGTDYFNYRINDGTDKYAYGSVAVTVTAAEENAVPVAHDDRYTMRPNTTLRMDAGRGVLANDTEVPGYRLWVDVFDGPQHGTLKIDIDGSFTYTPDADFSGTDSFTYAAADGLRTSEPVTVTIDVTAPTAVTVAGGGGAAPGVCWSSWLPNSYVPNGRVVPSCMVDLPRRTTERD